MTATGIQATVVVPARNEEGTISVCLESILAQDEPRLQVIVVDGASGDATAAVVRAYAARDPRVELVENPQARIPRALNLALARARAPFFVRVDAHAEVPPDYVRRCLEHLRSGRWGGVGGRKEAVGETAAGRAVAAAMGSRFGVGDSVYHYGRRPGLVDHVPFGAYPTALARELGGWNEALEANEDYEFDFRLRRHGHRILFDPALRIRWRCQQSLSGLFRQYRRYGRGKAAVARLHPASLRPRHLAAPALVVALGLAAALAPFRPGAAALLVAPYALALVGATAVTAGRADGWRARAWVPAAFVAMHVGWGLGFLGGLVGRGHGAPGPSVSRGADGDGRGRATGTAVAGDEGRSR